ncbi:MAG: tyrosine-type recombinase/integrase [bacterium]
MGIYKQNGSSLYWASIMRNGKRVRKSLKTANKKTAEIKYAEFITEITTGKKPEAEVIEINEQVKDFTFEELAKEYLEFAKNRLKSFKNRTYEVNMLARKFKAKKLKDFSFQDAIGIQNEVINKGQSKANANRQVACLKAMFKFAIDSEMVDETVYYKIGKCKNLKGEKSRDRYLKQDEFNKLLAVCPPFLKNIVIIAVYSGMRKSEILNLKWQDIDLTNKIISLYDTKNGENRKVYINSVLYDTLSKMKKQGAYVFLNPETKKPYCDIKKSFKTALNLIGISDFRFHDLRHTFASQSAMSGTGKGALQKLMGHKTGAMTERYMHLADDYLKDYLKENAELICHSFVIVDEIAGNVKQGAV